MHERVSKLLEHHQRCYYEGNNGHYCNLYIIKEAFGSNISVHPDEPTIIHT